MKIVQIKYFCGIVENGGFLAASAELNVTQPALSRQIIELEKELADAKEHAATLRAQWLKEKEEIGKSQKVAGKIEHLRAENERMAQVTKQYNDQCERLEKEIEEFTRKHLPPPPDGKKE